MRPLLLSLCLLLSLTACDQKDLAGPECSTPATVRDFTRLSGCGSVLELRNGQRLEPWGERWVEFPKVDGQRMTVTYREAPAASSCLAGKVTEVDCITALGK